MPENCFSCTQGSSCLNPCGECELCLGKTIGKMVLVYPTQPACRRRRYFQLRQRVLTQGRKAPDPTYGPSSIQKSQIADPRRAILRVWKNLAPTPENNRRVIRMRDPTHSINLRILDHHPPVSRLHCRVLSQKPPVGLLDHTVWVLSRHIDRCSGLARRLGHGPSKVSSA